MNFKIHRGTKEIGGSCVEVWTDSTRILFDFGMPLVEKDGSEFDFNKYKNFTVKELVKAGILPEIKGIYNNERALVDAVVLSHAHQDHYGLHNYTNPFIKCYLGRGTKRLIEINNLFTPQNTIISKPVFFEKEQSFQIGDITITPYWADHSAFDSYSFLIEANGKSIFYSGDFRGHGRKSKTFRRFIHIAPKNIDYLILEGSNLGREDELCKTEDEIEEDLIKLFQKNDKLNLIYTSGQNIDRLVSVYRACIKTGKIMVIDVYVAAVLNALSEFAKLPYPSDNYNNLKVFYSYYTSKRLTSTGNEKMLYHFKNYKISKDEISRNPEKYVMIVRPSMKKDLEHISGIDGGNLIYSLWEGYKSRPNTSNFLQYLDNRNFSIYNIHTSGHADIVTLKKMVEALNPKSIVPIHTFYAGDYKTIFSRTVVELRDGETLAV